jgi:putative glycosyltransferase (TIGR04372 family)
MSSNSSSSLYAARGRWLRRLRDAAVFAPLACVVLAIRLLRPLVLIRFGTINGARIGHYVFETDLYLCERRAGLHPHRSLDLFYYESRACNSQLARMFAREMWITRIAKRLDRVNRAIPGGEAHVVKILGRDTYAVHRDTHDLIRRMPPNISFTAAERERGDRELAELGVPPDAPIVCVHNRDSAYLNRHMPAADWGYHDYRDFPINDFRPAIEELIERGYYVLRMGQHVAEPLDFPAPQVIDYATRGRSDFLDLYIAWRCRFFVGNSAGLMFTATAFRRPVLIVNHVPLEGASAHGVNDLVVPKLIWSEAEQRNLTLPEVIGCGAATFYRGEDYAAAGLRVVNNEPEDIRAATAELDDRLRGCFTDTPRDLRLARQFKRLFESGGLTGELRTRLAATFLRRHEHLLPRLAHGTRAA